MIDAPGPWGTGPYTLVEGFSSLENEIGLIQAEPLACVWLDTGTPRSERVVLEANRDHWNSERGPRLERVVFRNELPPAEALELVGEATGRRLRIERRPPLPGDARHTGADGTRAEALLGYRPETDLASGLAAQVAWVSARQRAAAR